MKPFDAGYYIGVLACAVMTWLLSSDASPLALAGWFVVIMIVNVLVRRAVGANR